MRQRHHNTKQGHCGGIAQWMMRLENEPGMWFIRDGNTIWANHDGRAYAGLAEFSDWATATALCSEIDRLDLEQEHQIALLSSERRTVLIEVNFPSRVDTVASIISPIFCSAGCHCCTFLLICASVAFSKPC